MRPISILILLGLCVGTVTAQKRWNYMKRRVFIRLVIETRSEDGDMDAPFELQFRYIPPDRLQFEKDGGAFARIIGNQYCVKWDQGTWLRVNKETFEEMSALPPIATLALKDSAFSQEDVLKVRNLREIPEAGITIDGQRCRQYESRVTSDKESPPLHLVNTVWLTVKDKLPIKLVIRGYEGDSTDPVGILTMTFDYKTRFRIPTPIV